MGNISTCAEQTVGEYCLAPLSQVEGIDEGISTSQASPGIHKDSK
jgi:hypothetical protein